MGEFWKHYVKWIKAVTEEDTDSTDVKQVREIYK